MHAAADAVAIARALVTQATRAPADSIRWLPNQYAFLESTHKFRQIRQGNQWGGKSICAIAALVGMCVGIHPLHRYGFRYPRPRKGYEAWLITDSWPQAVSVMGKLWDLLPKHLIDPSTQFDALRGIKGKNPAVRFTNGSILRIKTANQDPKALSSGTINAALFDEPPTDERLLTEVRNRLQARGGTLLMSYTPVNAPVEYLKDMVSKGIIEDHHSVLTLQACIPVGKVKPYRGPDGKLRDQAWIDELRRTTSEVQAPVVIDGHWEFRAHGAWFSGAWNPKTIISATPPKTTIEYSIGLDLGSKPGKTQCTLVAVDELHPSGVPSIYVLDSYVATGVLPEDDARGIVALLKRNNVKWADIKYAMSDRVHLKGTGAEKSAGNIFAEIAKLYGVSAKSLTPTFWSAKRGEGRGHWSVAKRNRYLYEQMVRGHLKIHPRCTKLIEDIPKYTGADDGSKDSVDSLSYALDKYCFSQWGKHAPIAIKVA